MLAGRLESLGVQAQCIVDEIAKIRLDLIRHDRQDMVAMMARDIELVRSVVDGDGEYAYRPAPDERVLDSEDVLEEGDEAIQGGHRFVIPKRMVGWVVGSATEFPTDIFIRKCVPGDGQQQDTF